MSSYIAEKYAGILAEEDVRRLFETLTERLKGNRSESARRCGLTGKATYDWEKAGYVKLETKRKVLDACLETDFLNTIEFLLARSGERTADLLRTLLSTIYADAVEVSSSEGFRMHVDKFETLKMKHRGFIRDQIEEEVSSMTWFLKKKASELGVPMRERSIEDLSSQELLTSVQLLGHIYIDSPTEVENYGIEKLDLPKEILKPILQTFKELSYGKEIRSPSETVVWILPSGKIPTETYLPELQYDETAGPKTAIKGGYILGNLT